MIPLKRCITRAGAFAGAALLLGCGGPADSTTEPQSPPIPVFARAPCKDWSCQIARCGYDPATDPRGACCILRGDPPEVTKPSCKYVPPCKPGVNC